jgi:hypothetical protein
MKAVYGKKIKKIAYIDCKIIVFEVKKIAFFCTLQKRINRLFKTFPSQKVEISNIKLGNRVENYKKKKKPKNQKNFIFSFYIVTK